MLRRPDRVVLRHKTVAAGRAAERCRSRPWRGISARRRPRPAVRPPRSCDLHGRAGHRAALPGPPGIDPGATQIHGPPPHKAHRPVTVMAARRWCCRQRCEIYARQYVVLMGMRQCRALTGMSCPLVRWISHGKRSQFSQHPFKPGRAKRSAAPDECGVSIMRSKICAGSPSRKEDWALRSGPRCPNRVTSGGYGRRSCPSGSRSGTRRRARHRSRPGGRPFTSVWRGFLGKRRLGEPGRNPVYPTVGRRGS